MKVGVKYRLGLLMLCATLGCGGESLVPRYSLEGKASYNGKPIPRGMVVFSPDSSKGNNGPGAIAIIKDGQYSTEAGKGIVGGFHEVRISGYDGVPAGDLADGKPLFNGYVTTIDFPKKSGTHDFDVPLNSNSRTPSNGLAPP